MMSHTITIELPLHENSGLALRNLACMIASRQTLLQQALDLTEPLIDTDAAHAIRSQTIQTAEDFAAHWPSAAKSCLTVHVDQQTLTVTVAGLKPERVKAWTDLLQLLWERAKRSRWAITRPVAMDNPKFNMRVWIVRLGMHGAKYADSRRVLMERLPGSTAFRY